MVATAELADAGRTVILLDQEPAASLGGQAFWSFGGLFLVDTPKQRQPRPGPPPLAAAAGRPAQAHALRCPGPRRRPDAGGDGQGGRVIGADRMWHYPEGITNHSPIWTATACASCPGAWSKVSPKVRPVVSSWLRTVLSLAQLLSTVPHPLCRRP